MIYPERKEFLKLSRQGNLIPVYREIVADLETPVSAFLKIDRSRFSYLLESVEGAEKIARYSFIGTQPSLMAYSYKDTVIFEKRGKKTQVKTADPLKTIISLMSVYKFVSSGTLPRFCGGLVGYIGYDMVRTFEKLPEKNQDTLNLPDCVFMLTDTILIFDHIDHKIKIVCLAYTDKNPDETYNNAIKKIDIIIQRLRKPLYLKTTHSIKITNAKVKANFTKKSFEKQVRKAKAYINAGDAIQIVLSQRFETPVKCPPFDIYRALRSVNPSPYMYYIKMPQVNIVGASPEVFVRCENKIVEVRPIAGTRPRGLSEAKDKRLEKELLNDPKECAEHIMLVDLGRNDIGRICRYGSVKTLEFMVIEKYSHVMHIVSDCKGELLKGKTLIDVVKATFPAGTVSGAPKIRAMEIIEELENVRRGLYAGCIGYFSFSGNLDTCIAIRTAIIKNNRAYVQAGAGIVADSVPSKEYYETVNKAEAMLKAIKIANEGLE
ncbi:anthranilate synthase component I [bacterium Unc6]|nr:anthranilate synthase component I [bacterium Unc6]